MRPPRTRSLAIVLLASPLAGCTGATVGSGVGETRFEHAPYYAGDAGRVGPEARGGSVVAYAPVSYQAGATHDALFDPSGLEGSAVAALLAEMNAYLDTLAREGLQPGPFPSLPGTGPDVHFGCELDGLDECVLDDEGGLHGPGRARMRLAVGRPSAEWVAGATEALAAGGADALLVITLEVGQYWPRQVSWRGSKVVELGTDRTLDLPWVTAIDAPISVLQLTGALVSADGKVRRIGAEGLLARRTAIVASGFGAQALITDADVQALRSERTGGSDGAPPVWQVALRTLVRTLTGEESS